MTAAEIKTFPIKNCAAWTYRTKVHFGTCAVDGQRIKMQFTVTMLTPEAIPDVLAVETFCREMAREADTLEGYAATLAGFLGCEVTGVGKTRTHGVITCTISGRAEQTR